MFNDRRVSDLESEMKDMKDRYYKLLSKVSALEAEVAPFRVGEMHMYFVNCHDPRPKVTLRQAIDLLREHLRLKFTHADAIPARVEVEKIK